jgi:hypothetical protein
VLLIRFYKLLCFAMVAALSLGEARSDAIGTAAPGPVKIRKAPSMAATDPYDKKFHALQQAVQESDFERVISLFSGCANQGEPHCQFFLAEGISEGVLRTDDSKIDSAHAPHFVRKWLRKAYLSNETLGDVAMNWRAYYLFGYMGFPRDRELSECWSSVSIGNWNLENVRKRARKIAGSCEAKQKKKYGSRAVWLTR